jgi:hypothetical protein
MNKSFLTLAEAAKAFPRKVSLASIWRWSTRGVRGVFLRTVVVGGRRYVPGSDAINEFIDATTAASGRHPEPIRCAKSAAVDDVLQRAGIADRQRTRGRASRRVISDDDEPP